jgi:hypothetical protein
MIEGGTTPDRRPQMDRLVTDEMIPALASVAAISTDTRRPISVWDVNARA